MAFPRSVRVSLTSALLLCLLGAALPSISSAARDEYRATTAGISCPNQNLPYSDPNRPVLRAAVLCLVNQARAAYGLPALIENAQLDASAQGHSDDMVARNYFDHNSPGGSTPGSRDAAAGYPAGSYGENIAGGFSTPYAVMSVWMNDFIHCSDILDPTWQDMGLGINRNGLSFQSPPTWTQEFGLRQGDAAPSRNNGPENSCPHPLASLPSPRPVPAPNAGPPVAVIGQAAIRRRAILVRLRCVAAQTCHLSAQITISSLPSPQTSASSSITIGPGRHRRLRLRMPSAVLGPLRSSGQPVRGVLTLTLRAPDQIRLQDAITIST